MVTFLQPVQLPDRCFLQEALFWIAFRRVPIAEWTLDGAEIRTCRDVIDIDGHELPWMGADFLWEEEAKYARIPDDPSRKVRLEELPSAELEHYDRLMGYQIDEADRAKLKTEREQAFEFHAAYAKWEPHFQAALEYPASKLFVALRDGSLIAMGKPMEGASIEAAFATLNEREIDLFELDSIEIPSDFWTLKGINFEGSAASNGPRHFALITCDTKQMLSLFPSDREGEEVHGVVRIGETYIVNEIARPKTSKGRGRPAYPSERFHVELASVIQRGQLPQKKEAAIEHFQDWFVRDLRIRPSRAAIGEKLKPYYDRLFGQKIPK